MSYALRMIIFLVGLITPLTGCGRMTPRALLEPEGVHIIREWTYATVDDQSERLHAVLTAAGGSSTIVLYDHLSHSDEALLVPDVMAKAYAFLDSHLHPVLSVAKPGEEGR